MELKDYKPIDYRTWVLGDEARKGVNIKKLGILTREELKIFDESIPCQDQRNDPGHGEMTAYFALKLLEYLPGVRQVAVPAAMLHDIGWYGNDPQAWKRLVEANKDNLQALESEALRRPHQNRGCLLTGKVLERTGYFDRYPVAYWLDIADITGDHDTRKLPPSDSGRIVRAADLLWRTTYPHAQIYYEKENPEQLFEKISDTCTSKELAPYLGEVGTAIARVEIANMMLFRYKEQAVRLLEKNYPEELKRIRQI